MKRIVLCTHAQVLFKDLNFSKYVKEFGIFPLRRTPSIFLLRRNGESPYYLELNVDDFVLGSTSEIIIEVCEDFLEEKFKVKCTDKLKKFVGIELFNNKNQQTMTKKFLEVQK